MMADNKLEWIRDSIYQHLDIADPSVFQNWLDSDDGLWRDSITNYLTTTREGCDAAVAFFKEIHEEDEEFEVEVEVEALYEERVEEEEEEKEDAEEAFGDNETNKLLAASAEESVASISSSALGADTKVKKKKRKKEKAGRDKPVETKFAKERATSEAAAEAATAAAVAAPAQKDDRKQVETRLITRKVQRTYLFMVPGADITWDLVSNHTCLFFIRRLSEGGIPEVREKTALDKTMRKHFDTAVMNGDGLTMLYEVICEVYQPLLAYFEHRQSYAIEQESNTTITRDQEEFSVRRQSEMRSEDSIDNAKVTASTSVTAVALRDEFLISLRKFQDAANVVFENLTREALLIIPSNAIFEGTLDEYLANDELQKTVQKTCIGWFTQV
jgi:hypothetical protein